MVVYGGDLFKKLISAYSIHDQHQPFSDFGFKGDSLPLNIFTPLTPYRQNLVTSIPYHIIPTHKRVGLYNRRTVVHFGKVNRKCVELVVILFNLSDLYSVCTNKIKKKSKTVAGGFIRPPPREGFVIF
jgi:hypothetical protein